MIDKSETIKELAAALVKAQAAIQPAIKDKTNPAFRSRYADLTAVWDACRTALTSNGLSIVQMPIDAEAGRVALTTMLLHTSGEYISSTVSTALVKTDPQGVGSALTYLRRYALSAMVGVVADEDDDGNAASQPRSNGGAAYAPPKPQPPTMPTNSNAPKTAGEAKERFFARYADIVGGRDWSNVQIFLMNRAPSPGSIEGWIAAADAVRDKAKSTKAAVENLPGSEGLFPDE